MDLYPYLVYGLAAVFQLREFLSMAFDEDLSCTCKSPFFIKECRLVECPFGTKSILYQDAQTVTTFLQC